MQGTELIELWCEKCQNPFWVNKSVDTSAFFCPLCKTRTEIKNRGLERVPYEEIKSLWNETCISFPKVVSITNKRRKSLRCRWEELKQISQFEDAFRKLEASDFCKGINDKGWTASFDWIIANETNIIKVLEGKYANNSVKNSRGEFNKARDLSYLVE